MYSTQDFRNGLKIEYQGEPYLIVEFQHVKPGKGGAFVRTKIKNLKTGRVLDPTFKSGDKVGKPDLEERDMQYLYQDGEYYTFMDNTTYEQTLVNKEALGEAIKYLKENDNAKVLLWNGQALSVECENKVVLKITQCEPGLKGDTATGATKPATLETGYQVNVPLFINEGEHIEIDTRTGAYVGRGNV